MTERSESIPYWNEVADLGHVYFGRQLRAVALRSHVAIEHYHGLGSEELFVLEPRTGERTYVQSRFYTPATPGIATERRLADGQAWWYPLQQTIVLWEVVLEPAFYQDDPREDLFLRSVWLGYERCLAERFADAHRLLTTWEDTYRREEWQGFLTTLGYRQTAPATFSKSLLGSGLAPR